MIRIIGIDDPEFDEIPYAPEDFPLSYEYAENTAEISGLLEVLEKARLAAEAAAAIAVAGKQILTTPPTMPAPYPQTQAYYPPAAPASQYPFLPPSDGIGKLLIPIGIAVAVLGGGYMLLSGRKKRRRR